MLRAFELSLNCEAGQAARPRSPPSGDRRARSPFPGRLPPAAPAQNTIVPAKRDTGNRRQQDSPFGPDDSEPGKYCLGTGHRAAVHRGAGHRAAVDLSAWRYLGATTNSISLKSLWFGALPAGRGQRPKRLGLPTDAVRFWHLSASSSRAQIPQPPGRSPPGGLSRQSVKPQPGLRLSSSIEE